MKRLVVGALFAALLLNCAAFAETAPLPVGAPALAEAQAPENASAPAEAADLIQPSATGLNVTGSGTVYMQADRASASLGVTLSGEDLGELQKEANEAVANICDALFEAGLEEDGISTNYIYISPRYDYSEEIEKMVGYSINNSLTITTSNIDNIGTYIDAAFAAGANTFDSINFTIQDDSQGRKQALELAVKDAQMKAETIAEATGHKLGDILEVSEGIRTDYYTNNAGSGAMYYAKDSASESQGTTVRAAQVSITANVQISYQMN